MAQKEKRSLPVARRDISAPRREVFLAQLRDHGVVTWAAIAASPHTDDRKGASSSFYSLRRVSAAFSQEWDDALAEANDRLVTATQSRTMAARRMKPSKPGLTVSIPADRCLPDMNL